MLYKLDENKNAIPCTVEEWSNQLEDMLKNDTKHVAEETIGDKWISTVWVGLNHQYMKGNPPLLFETMIFNNLHEIYCRRYSTYNEALEGHEEAKVWLKTYNEENNND